MRRRVGSTPASFRPHSWRRVNDAAPLSGRSIMHILGFDYHDDCFHYLEHDMWCRALPDGLMQVGVNAFGVYLSGDFFMCRPKPAGTELRQGDTLGVVELSKSVVTIKTPLTGRIAEVNPALADSPELIHRDPYGRGWLVTIVPMDLSADLARLAHGDALEEAATKRMRLEKLPPQAQAQAPVQSLAQSQASPAPTPSTRSASPSPQPLPSQPSADPAP
jgi:glycine cleavage system H protein